MNKLTIIGNLTKDPEMGVTAQGKQVCTFSVAVNRRKRAADQPGEDFFRVGAWEALGENCYRYLHKGKKVAVIGEVSVHTYKNKDGDPGASMEVNAKEVEFLSPSDNQ